ncbi:hypothetical protein FIBSPDRAFT_223476 [Athelia psychrophila]|uniref:Uncharacterized protein n=1 Tax=Athelia psychrophila TaxID=1759441 RepID=A0A166S4M3_9AGAM|nr:hypothetical protein FIBSPDRAFT_223476 [Fibularhizoctonia sp. CBS 109695]
MGHVSAPQRTVNCEEEAGRWRVHVHLGVLDVNRCYAALYSGYSVLCILAAGCGVGRREDSMLPNPLGASLEARARVGIRSVDSCMPWFDSSDSATVGMHQVGWEVLVLACVCARWVELEPGSEALWLELGTCARKQTSHHPIIPSCTNPFR